MTETQKFFARIISGGALMCAGFGGFPLSLVCCLIGYIIVGYDVLLRAGKNIAHGRILDEHFLMTIASVGAFLIGEYPEAVAVMLFYQVGEYLLDQATDHSKKDIRALMSLRPDTACLKTPHGEKIVSPQEVGVGDTIICTAGQRVPLDGIVCAGATEADTSALTGEAVPVLLGPGSSVLSGSVVKNGRIEVRVTRPAAESTVERILRMVRDAEEKKAKPEHFITRFAKIYTPAVVLGAAVIAVLPPLLGGVWTDWIRNALIFLVASCPCALVVSIPLSFFAGIGGAAARGILVRGSGALEKLALVDTIAFDKTGTLTQGCFTVQRVVCAPGFEENEVLKLAAGAEKASTHPIAKGIAAYCPDAPAAEEFFESAGGGVRACVQARQVLVGSAAFLRENGAAEVRESPGAAVYVAVDRQYAGCIFVRDVLKPTSAQTVLALKTRGIRSVMLSGDRPEIARKIAQEAGIDAVHAGLLPDQKVSCLEELMHNSRGVAFVGDGINDAPVLARADVGIAMGGMGADAAIEAADIVVMQDDLKTLLTARAYAKKTRRIAMQNIVIAIAVKAGVLGLSAFGLANVWEAVFADVGVAVICIFNAMRARRVREEQN